MKAELLERKPNATGYVHVDILVDNTVFHCGIAKPDGHYAERITTAENIVKVINEAATQNARIAELESYIRIICSIPAVVDIEKQITASGYNNPITDARNSTTVTSPA